MRVNWLAVLICTVVAFLLRYLWTAHFGGADWGHFIGRAVNNIQNDKRAAGLALVNALVIAIAIGWLVGRLRDRALATGLAAGLAAAVGFAATTVSVEYISGGATLRTFLIDAGYYVAAYVLMGAIAGAMAPKKKAAAAG
jgi:hypothetical protein